MKTVKLSKSEIDVILDCITYNNLCLMECHCGYKGNMCNKKNANGEYRCKLKQTIKSINDKLKGVEGK